MYYAGGRNAATRISALNLRKVRGIVKVGAHVKVGESANVGVRKVPGA